MSLVEKLGGYDFVSGFYKRALEYGFVLGEIRDALLEHRRQHNIFEPDDWIIFDGELMVFAMWSERLPDHAYIGYAYAEDGELAHKSEFRHATDAEMAQGYRDE